MALAPHLLVLAAAAATAPAATQGEVVTRTFDAGAIRELTLDNASGNVTVKGSDARQATVSARKVRFDEGCQLTIEHKGDKLEVASKDPASLLGAKQCQVELTVELPRAAAVDLRVGTGDVELSGLRGEVEYKVGSGDLKIVDADLRELDGKSGSGDVSLTGNVGEAELKLGAGDADITFSKAPQAGRLDVKVGMGSATIKLPKDSRIKSNFKAGMGSLTNELGDAPDAKFVISGSAGAGDMTIRRL